MSSSKLSRRTALVGMAVAVTSAARAEGLSTRPIKILVGFGAGGASDTVARIYAAKLTELLNTPVIVENKPGAMQQMAGRPVMAAAPDGYTLWLATSSALVQTPGVRDDLPYDTLKNFTQIAEVAKVDGIFAVRSGLPVNSMRELIDYARANPGKLNYGSAGVGSGNHLLTEYVKVLTHISMTHIPYKNDADVVRELLAGTIDFAIIASGSMLQFASSPKLRILGVTGSRRIGELPGVPTVAESGIDELKGLGDYLFYGVLGPAGMPAPLVQSLSDALNKAAHSPDVVEHLQSQFFHPVSGTPAEFRGHMERELAIWKGVGKTMKITASSS